MTIRVGDAGSVPADLRALAADPGHRVLLADDDPAAVALLDSAGQLTLGASSAAVRDGLATAADREAALLGCTSLVGPDGPRPVRWGGPDAAPAERFLRAAALAANAAASAVAGLQRSAPVGTGADGAPTEAADRAAEAAALARLRTLGLPVLSEEAGLVDGPVGESWIALDPLDGSRNFRAGLAPYATAVGLVRDGQPLAGYVLDHTTGRRWWAVAGGGAWADGRPLERGESPRPDRGDSRLLALPSPATATATATATDYPGFDRIRVSGSTTVDLCRVADGSLAAFDARHRDVVHVHDLAGPLAVLAASGAHVRTAAGAPPVLRPDAGYCQRLVAAGSAEDLRRLLPARRVQPPATVRIRPATTGDRDAVARLLGQLGYEHPPASVGAMLAEIGGDVRHHLLVAESGGRVVGLLGLDLRRQLHHCACVGQIDELVVDETVRGQAVGAALLERAAQLAKERDADVLELTAALHRTSALRFYERNGFQVTSRKLVRPLKGGAG